MATVIRMPAVLANATEASIQTWLVAPGDTVSVGGALAEVETDKAVVEYASEIEGTVLELLVAEGQTVEVGQPIAVVGADGEQVPVDVRGGAAGASVESVKSVAEPAAAPEPETAPEARPSPVMDAPTELGSSAAQGAAQSSGSPDRQVGSPLVRRLAREHGLDLSGVTGSGPGGRIVRRDIDDLVVAAESSPGGESVANTEPVSVPSAVETVPLTSMRRAIARRLVESKTTIPHYYLVAHCQVDALLELRRQINEDAPTKISVNDLVVKAAAAAYMDVPEANSTWAGDAIHRHAGVDIAVAVAVPGGLVTPVLRGVDKRSLSTIGRQVADLAERARAGRLQQHELEGGVATISNLGMYGMEEFSAIINPPQSAILAIGAARQQAVVRDGELAVANVMTVTMSADHRVLDGALGAQWLAAFVGHVERPLRMLV